MEFKIPKRLCPGDLFRRGSVTCKRLSQLSNFPLSILQARDFFDPRIFFDNFEAHYTVVYLHSITQVINRKMYVRSLYVILFVRHSSWEPLAIVYPLTVTKYYAMYRVRSITFRWPYKNKNFQYQNIRKHSFIE